MPSYTVGGLTFTTKEALAAHVQAILRSYSAGARVNDEDAAFLADLLLRHPSADEKIGVGIAAFYVMNVAYGSKGFILERLDGTRTDWSYRQCIRPFTYASKVKHALRVAVADQVLAAKRITFPDHEVVTTCPITGQAMTYHDAHVDHIPPDTFAALVERFLDTYQVILDDVVILPAPSGISWVLADDWAAVWSAFHQQHARLRVISAHANMRLVR